MTIEEILKLNPDKAISYLKKRKTKEPNTEENLSDWDVDKHEIIVDKEKYPDRKTLVSQEKTEFDDRTGREITIPAKYETEPANRISIPLEQDIVNAQTAFTVGAEPKLNCDPMNDAEKNLLQAVGSVFKKNKIKYQNKKIVRSWLSEQEVAEYWYAVKDSSFWEKFWAKTKVAFWGKTKPNVRLRSVLWSPFRGDKLYPYFDDYGDLVAISREYIRTTEENIEITCFQTVTNAMVYHWENLQGWKLVPEKSFAHGFNKIPAIYAYRDKPYCYKIKAIRERIEKLLSNYADCIDYHFFPILKLFGDVEGVAGRKKDRIVKLTGNDANADYLIWQQAPETVKLELETMFTNAYAMTNTPRISFESMKGFGETPSGTAFRFVFMGAHMSVENHAEDIGNFMQRRVNFIVSALGEVNPYEFGKASKTIDIESEIVPYMIDSLSERVEIAIKAKEGGVWSQRTAVIFAGNTDHIEEELELIKQEEADKKKEEAKNNAGKSVV